MPTAADVFCHRIDGGASAFPGQSTHTMFAIRAVLSPQPKTPFVVFRTALSICFCGDTFEVLHASSQVSAPVSMHRSRRLQFTRISKTSTRTSSDTWRVVTPPWIPRLTNERSRGRTEWLDCPLWACSSHSTVCPTSRHRLSMLPYEGVESPPSLSPETSS